MALKFTIILQNLKTANHRKNDVSKYDRKLAKIDVVTTCMKPVPFKRGPSKTICAEKQCVEEKQCVAVHEPMLFNMQIYSDTLHYQEYRGKPRLLKLKTVQTTARKFNNLTI